jgi:hypothetical protein
MSRTLFIFLWLVFLASCDKMDISPSQADSFIKFYNTFPVFTGADVKEIPGRGYVILGTVTSTTEGKQICLIRTDLYGNSIDSARYYGGPLDDEACCLQIFKDHGLGILGQSTDAANKKGVYFIKTDSVGNIEYEKTFTGTYDIVPFKFRLSGQDSIYIIGSGKTTRNDNPLNNDVWLNIMDKDGNVKVSKYLGFPVDDEGRDIQLIPGGGLVITGITYSPDNIKHSFVLKTNPFGNGGFLFPIVNSPIGEEANSIQIIDQNTFIISGTTKSTEKEIMMKKVSFTTLGMNVEWEKYYGQENDKGVSHILDGSNIYLLATTASAGINSTITLITTDLEGDNAVYSEIGEGTQLSASAFQKTADNGFIIAGTNKHTENDQSMTLIKLKSNASLW